MFRLTRQIRCAIQEQPDSQLSAKPTNSFGGFPSLVGLATYLEIDFTLEGPLEPNSSYLRNIKDVDDIARRRAIPLVSQAVFRDRGSGFDVPLTLLRELSGAWPGATLESVRVRVSPTLSVEAHAREESMIRLNQKFEFSASHRLHNPALSDAENRACFGKCNNPHGHGHNYEVQVTLVGRPDSNGLLIPVPEFERIVGETVIDKFDHKNLNIEVNEFQSIIPSVENIAMVTFRLLAPQLQRERVRLASVTVWETPKTWCEYSE